MLSIPILRKISTSHLLSSEIQVMRLLVWVVKTIAVYCPDKMNESLSASFGIPAICAVVFLTKWYLQLIRSSLERWKSICCVNIMLWLFQSRCYTLYVDKIASLKSSTPITGSPNRCAVLIKCNFATR